MTGALPEDQLEVLVSMADDGLFERIRYRGHPAADPRSLVIAGSARFTVLTDRMLRLEWSPAGTFDDRATYAFPSRLTSVPEFQVSQAGSELTISTSALALHFQLGCTFEPGTLSADRRSASAGGNGAQEAHELAPSHWYPELSGLNNLRGTRRTLDACEGDASLEAGLLSRSGWALFDDSRSVRFAPTDGWVAPSPEQPYLDWYLFAYGHDYKAALAEYTSLGGPIPLIPRYVLGAWWSRYWAYSDRDLKRLVREFERRRFPLDVLVIDMDWHTPHAWTGYTWNRTLFPDPPAFLKWVHDKGLRATLNLHPAQGVQPFEEVYSEFARALGMDPSSGQAIPFRISDPAFVKSYFELLHHPLEEQGVDFWWVDWQQGETSEMKDLDPLPWLNHLHYHDSRRRSRRPMLYSRWGGLGNHRYPIGFSGDTYATWTALQFQPYLTATAANVAYGWWSHDIGGHMGGATDPELFARWVQFGALSPVLRLHATKDARAERRPWAYPRRVCRAARKAFLFRYQIIPYLYTMARSATDSGLSLCRPMYYEHPEEKAAYVARYQYYLGDQLIAAPIVHPANPGTCLAAADVWLPQGTWVDFFTLETFSGPGWVRILGDLDRIPLLVRAGGIVPLAGAMRPGSPPHLSSGTTWSIPDDRLTLAIFPGEHGAFRLYEDDGTTEAYLDGQYEWTPITSRIDSPSRWEVHIGAAEGHCASLPRARCIEIRLIGSREPESVALDGRPHPDWSYEARSLTTIIRVPEHDRRLPITVTASSSLGVSALGDSHNLRLIRRDVARLLGLRQTRRLQRASRAELLDTVLDTPCPGQADAVARLGGPFVRVIENGEIERAQESMGKVIVAAPRLADETFDVDVRLGMEPPSASPAERGESTCRLRAAAEDLILDAPPAPLHPIRAARWHADVSLMWRGAAVSHHHESQPLFPTVCAWQGLVLDQGTETEPWEQVCDPLGLARAGLAWRDLSQALDGLVNVHQPHLVDLSRHFAAVLKGILSPVAYLVTTVASPSEQEAVFQFRSPGLVKLRLNGDPVGIVPGEYDGTIHPRLRPTRRTELLRLRTGDNHLVVQSRPAPGGGGRWLFGGSLTSPRNEVLVGLSYRLPCVPLP